MVGGTVGSAVVGAGGFGLLQYLAQRATLKKPTETIDRFTRGIAEATAAGNTKKIQFFTDAKNTAQELINSGKYNKKLIASSAAIGAAVLACAYVLIRGASMVLFSKDK